MGLHTPYQSRPLRNSPLSVGIAVFMFWVALSGLAVCYAQAPPTSSGAKSSAPSKKASTSSLEEGKQIFESVCATCHGLDARGAERGPNIGTRPDVVHMSDKILLEILHNGKPAAGMPPFAYFGEAKLQSVLLHLRTLQGRAKVTTLPGDAARGAQLFAGKAECGQCHAVNGVGGFLAPELTNYAGSLPLAEIRSAIVDPNKNLAPRRGLATVTGRDGKTYSGIARNEDNFSLQLQTADGAFHFFQKSEIEKLQYQQKSLMPADYGTRLSAAEIDDLISYLIKVARAKAMAKKGEDAANDEEYED